MFTPSLIERKRDGGSLAPAEWRALIEQYTAGTIPDYQMSALLMAVLFNGVDPAELAALTDAMRDSGARLTFGDAVPPRVDKHSTGGVGDKVSLLLAPLAASCGLAVPMMSGRGLGHTGGTLDKLESIPGFRTTLSLDEARRQVERIGCAMLGQSPEIAPADRKLYALRDATATVESIPLISASIMSKKLAEGLNGLVLDVKRGSGAFLTDLDDELALAQTMIRLGGERGCPTVALLTAMDRPLGYACGNALEVDEAFAALRGEGPSDLQEVTLALGSEMLVLGGLAPDPAAARPILEAAIAGGQAAERCRALVEAQGGPPAIVDDPAALPRAPRIEEYHIRSSGTVARIDPRTIGRAVVAMGGGRTTVDDAVDPSVGFVIRVKPGDGVASGDAVASIHAADDEGLAIGRAALDTAIRVAQERADVLPLVSHRITASGVEVMR